MPCFALRERLKDCQPLFLCAFKARCYCENIAGPAASGTDGRAIELPGRRGEGYVRTVHVLHMQEGGRRRPTAALPSYELLKKFLHENSKNDEDFLRGHADPPSSLWRVGGFGILILPPSPPALLLVSTPLFLSCRTASPLFFLAPCAISTYLIPLGSTTKA